MYRFGTCIVGLFVNVVVDVFKANSPAEHYGLIFISDSKSKNFDTVKVFEEATIEFVKSKGYMIER